MAGWTKDYLLPLGGTTEKLHISSPPTQCVSVSVCVWPLQYRNRSVVSWFVGVGGCSRYTFNFYSPIRDMCMTSVQNSQTSVSEVRGLMSNVCLSSTIQMYSNLSFFV